MKKIVLKVAIAVGMLTLIGGLLLAQTGNDLFQQALVKERTEGNLQEAIRLYQTIVQKYGSDRKLASRALFQMGQAYEKLGNTEARKVYERIAREFGDQPEAAGARTRLAALEGARSSPALAARMLWSGRGVDLNPSIMPDGRLMLTDWSTGDLGIREMATGEMKRLMVKSETFKESNNYGEMPVLSPNLRQVAFTWWDDARRIFELRVTGIETGSQPRVLIRNAEFRYLAVSDWSPDGTSVLVNLEKQDGTRQIAWVSVKDGTTRVLRSLDWRLRGRSRLSPDGRYIAYSASDGSNPRNTGIYIIASNGSDETVLVKPTGFNGQPTWTPDGKHLMYLSDRSGNLTLWSIALEDGKGTGAAPAIVKSDVGMISPIGFTRSGSYYYGQTNGSEDVFIGDLEAASGKIRGRAAVTERFVGSNRTPVWSPDGKFITFHSARQRSNDYLADVVIHSIDTGQEKTYAMDAMRVAGNPVWFRDGKALLQAMRNQQGSVFFYRIDLNTGEYKQLVATGATSNSVQLALSPDQRTVYTNLAGGSAGSPGIRAFNLASGQQSPVFTAQENGRVTGLGLSPDGRTLAFKVVYPGKFETRVCVIGVDGSNFRDLYTDTFDVDRVRPQLAWTKDGRTILFTRYPSYEDWQLMRIPAEGGKPEFTGLAGKGTAGIDLSPDGSRIAFNDGTPGIPELWTLDNLPLLKR